MTAPESPKGPEQNLSKLDVPNKPGKVEKNPQLSEMPKEQREDLQKQQLKTWAEEIDKHTTSDEVINTLRKNMSAINTRVMLEAEQDQAGTLGVIFAEKKELDKDHKEVLRNVKLKESYKEGDEVLVNFTANGSREANRTIGAGDLLPPSVRYAIIIDDAGNEHFGVRLSRGTGGKMNRTGYYDQDGNYIPVYDHYRIKIPSSTDPRISDYGSRVTQKTKDGERIPFLEQFSLEYGNSIPRSAIDTDTGHLQSYGKREREARKDRISNLQVYDDVEEKYGKGTLHLQESQKQVLESIATIANDTISRFGTSEFLVTAPPPNGEKIPLKGIFGKLADKKTDFIAHLQAVAYMESGYRQSVVSPCGAMGLFQFMPATWRTAVEKYQSVLQLNEDEMNPKNIEGQIKLATLEMARMYYSYNDFELVSAAWHSGEGNRTIIGLARDGSKDYNRLNTSDGLCYTSQYVARIKNLREQDLSSLSGVQMVSKNPSQGSEAAELPKDGILYVGDSLTVGYAYQNQEVPGIAKVGKSVFAMEQDFDGIINRKPKAIVLLGGTNDLYNEASAESVFGSLQRMVQKAEQAGIKIMVGTVPPMGKYLDEKKPQRKDYIIANIHKLNGLISSQFAGEYIDFDLALKDPSHPDYLLSSSDGLHPSTFGQMAAAVRQSLHGVQMA